MGAEADFVPDRSKVLNYPHQNLKFLGVRRKSIFSSMLQIARHANLLGS